ncbi:MAG: 16S rRNA (uracil(1498)-N(3))-methyltransferase [Pseudomonadota bacterium]
MKGAKVRLYVDHPLGAGQSVPLSREQAHYLFGVMRLGVGDAVLLFNGHAGEWRVDVAEAGKRGGTLVCAEQTTPQHSPPDLWLLFAPIKKARTDFIVEKATELGAARICPVQTEFTNAERIRRDRLQAHAVEAAEQCGGTFVPPVEDIRKLSDMLTNWPADRKLIFCDEALAGPSFWSKYPGGRRQSRRGAEPPKAAILIGPEGGFSDAERTRLRAMAETVSLGPRILRADTAAVAAMALWQAAEGDWQ